MTKMEELKALLLAEEKRILGFMSERRKSFTTTASHYISDNNIHLTNTKMSVERAEGLVGAETKYQELSKMGLLEWQLATTELSFEELVDVISKNIESIKDKLLRNGYRPNSTSMFANAVRVAEGDAMAELWQILTFILEAVEKES